MEATLHFIIIRSALVSS